MNQISYIGIKFHFIDNYKIYGVCVKADQIKGEFTAEIIENFITQSLYELNLTKEQVVSVTTDGAASFEKAGQSISKHIHCVAHRLNLVVEDGLESSLQLVNLIEKIRNIVTLFKKISLMMDELQNLRSDSGLSVLKLIQDVPTRWNSTFLMIERYLLLHIKFQSYYSITKEEI